MNKFLPNVLASVVMILLTACGGSAGGDIEVADIKTAAFVSAPAAASPEIPIQSAEKSAQISLQSSNAPLVAGSTFVIEPSRPGVSLDLFSAEVRVAVDKLDTDRAAPLQWMATFKNAPRRHAVVIIIDVGAKAQTASVVHSVLPSDSANQLSPTEHKRAACLGAQSYSTSAYYKAETAYSEATEAMAVGMAIGTPNDQVYARLDQLQAEEDQMAPDQRDLRYLARLAIRDQRYRALEACAAG